MSDLTSQLNRRLEDLFRFSRQLAQSFRITGLGQLADPFLELDDARMVGHQAPPHLLRDVLQILDDEFRMVQIPASLLLFQQVPGSFADAVCNPNGNDHDERTGEAEPIHSRSFLASESVWRAAPGSRIRFEFQTRASGTHLDQSGGKDHDPMFPVQLSRHANHIIGRPFDKTPHLKALNARDDPRKYRTQLRA